MMKRNFVVCVFAAMTMSATAVDVLAQDSCNRIVELGFKNIKKKYGERASLAYKYRSYCGKDYKDWKDQQLIDASVDVVGSWNADAGYTRNSAETTLKTWCDNSKDLASASGKDIEESEEINRESVAAWLSCKRLYAQGVLFEALTTDEVVDIKLRYTGSSVDGVRFYGVEPINFKCKTAFPGGADASTQPRVRNEAISIYCQRAKEVDAKGRAKGEQFKKRERASITVRTAAPEPYTLSFVDEWQPNVPLAESSRLETLLKKQDETVQSLSSRLAAQEQGNASMNAAVAAAAGRIASLEGTRSSLQAGLASVGPTGRNEARIRVNFHRPFAAPPIVVATARSHPNDFIIVDTTAVDTNGFDLWLIRINGGAWGGIQEVNWIAFPVN